jgi:hypothetical protein
MGIEGISYYIDSDVDSDVDRDVDRYVASVSTKFRDVFMRLRL